MQDGNLSVEEMRGFAAPDDSVPAIVVNTNDDPRARAFTVVHELGHLLLAALGEPTGAETEAWCDDFAGEVILPRHWLERRSRSSTGGTPSRWLTRWRFASGSPHSRPPCGSVERNCSTAG